MRHDQAKLAEQAAQLIEGGGALLDPGMADAVQAEHGLLLGALDRDEAHAGPGNRLADSLGIVAVVLAALTVGDHELGRHDADPMPERGKLPGPGPRTGVPVPVSPSTGVRSCNATAPALSPAQWIGLLDCRPDLVAFKARSPR